jgi:3-methyladenine DNA glycosylase/8-oxoguanine DNA glycosylase
MDLFGALPFQIAGQQLSVAATRRTLARIEARFGGSLPSAAYLFSAAFDEAQGPAARAGHSALAGESP